MPKFDFSDLKKYADEVEFNIEKFLKPIEEELIFKICENIEIEKEYSKEFVEWYNGLENKYPHLFQKEET